MRISAQGGTADFNLDVRSNTGSYIDPDNLTLTFTDVLGTVQVGFPVAYPGAITKAAVGQYSYEWTVPADLPVGTYTAEWSGMLLGYPTTAMEQWEVVPAGVMTTGGFDFLLDPEDYDAIRGLLGVTTLDVENKDIELLAFGPQAEMLVKRRITSWQTLNVMAEPAFILRMATVYKVACLMAQSFVRGGTIGLARPLNTGEGRDWKGAAEQFCAQYEYWINEADKYESDSENGADYKVDPLFIGGPTSQRIARRASGGASTDPSTASWYSYPPFWR